MVTKKIQQLQAALPPTDPIQLPVSTPAPMGSMVGGDVQGNLPVGPSAFELSTEQLQRKDKATTGDYIGSMYRQDSLIDGTVAAIVGQELMPQDGYNVHDPEVWKELSQGISPEFQSGLYDAHSPAHAGLIRSRILQKQEDLTRLGDMGVAGNIGRLGLSLVMPDQLLIGLAGGWVTKGYKAAELGMAATKGASALSAAETAARVVAGQTARDASGAAMAAGIAAGGVGNAAFEKIRQNVSFEDNNSDVLIAGLMGAAITAPFAYAGSKTESRIAKAAAREHETLKALKMLDDGQPLSADQYKTIKSVVDTHRTIREMQTGAITPEEGRIQLDSHHFGPEMEDAAWLKQYGDDIHAQGEAMLDQMYPNRISERTQKKFTPDGQPLQLGYEAPIPNYEGRVVTDAEGRIRRIEGKQVRGLETLKVDSKGNVAPSLDPAAVEAHLEAAAQKKFPKDAAKREAFKVDERTKMQGLEAPTTLKERIKAARDAENAAKKKAYDDAKVKAEEQRAINKKTNDALQAKADAHGDMLSASSKRADENKVKNDSAAEKAHFEAQIASHFGLDKPKVPDTSGPDIAGIKKMIDDINPQAAAEAPKAPKSEPKAPADAPVAPLDVKAPEALVKRKVGDYADFTKRNDPGGTHAGLVESISPDGDFYKIRDEDGNLHTVHSNRIMQHEPPPSGFLDGSVGAAQHMAIADYRTQLTAMSKARLDIYATLNRSESDEVRKLVFDLVKDPIQNDDVSAQGMTASEHKSQLKRTVAGIFHRESREAANEAAKFQGIPMWQRFSGEWDQNFHSLVSRYTRGDLTIQGPHKDILPMIQKAAKAQRNVYDYLLDQAKKMGVKGAENVDPNANYVNRIWNQKGINDAYRLHGEDAVHDLLARAINVPGFVGDVAKAKQFLGTVRKLEFSPVMQNIHLYAQDMGSLRRVLETEGKLGSHEIANIVDMMFTSTEAVGKDTGRTPTLKYRFDIDETMSQNVKGKVLRISDLLENDSRVLVDLYTNSMGGQIALAKKGIFSQADFMERMRKIGDDLNANPGWDQAKAKRDMRLLEDVYANISGKPMSTQAFDGPARVAATLRGYSRALSLGQLGIAAAFEMHQAVVYMGLGAALKQMPSFRQFFSAIKNGHIPNSQLARDIEHMVGFGTEMDMSYARVHEIDEGGMGHMLTKLESGANKASHAVDIMSGNASITSMTRQWSAMMGVQEMHDLATGLKPLTDATRKRFVGHGLDFHEIDGILVDFKQYSTATKGHKVESVEWEKWLKEEPETYEKFQLALSRKVRDAVQDQDLGETMPFMHTTLGKVFGELKTFMLVAHAKNFLKNLHYADGVTAQLYMFSIVSNALAYMTQSSINYAQDPAKLQEMLTLDRISRAVFARSANLGVMSIVGDTAYGIATGGDTLLRSGSTTNTDNRSAFVTPSLQLMQKLATAPSTLAGMALPNTVTTQKEFNFLPMPNLYGVRNAASSMSSMFPKFDPAHKGQ